MSAKKAKGPTSWTFAPTPESKRIVLDLTHRLERKLSARGVKIDQRELRTEILNDALRRWLALR